MFATATISTILVIPHAIVAVMWHWPPTIANLHYVITLGFWIVGVVFVTRRPIEFVEGTSPQQEADARPLSPEQRKAMSEIDRLNALLDLTDE